MSVQAEALRLHELHFCVVPPTLPEKRPDVASWTHYQEVCCTAEEIAGWYANGREGIGLMGGRISGNLELFEFEGRAVEEGLWKQFKATARRTGLAPLLTRVCEGWSDRSPSGGIHLHWRCSEPVEGNTELARRPATEAELAERPEDKVKVLIETRGQGGYMVIAPTPGYKRLRGSPETIATVTAEEREALFDLARSLDQMPRQAVAAPAGEHGERPGDEFNRRARWSEILGPHGWRYLYTKADGNQCWQRPGKDRGHSATISDGGDGVLYVFSSSTPFDTRKAYSKFAAFTLLEHGGDWSAAVRQLQTEGYGKPQAQNSAERRSAVLELGTADADDIEAVDWWWENYLALGGFAPLDGDPGLGKSVILGELVACATTGRALADGSRPLRQGGALMFAAEDFYKRTVLPRLKAAGADLGKVKVIHAVDHGQALELPTDVGTLEALIEGMGAVLVTFDPWERYLNADILKGREQRLSMEPVFRMAARHGCMLVGSRHLNQQSGQRALYRGRGDITLIGVSRFGFMVGRDPKSEDPGDFVMTPTKHNLARADRVSSFRYRLEEVDLGSAASGKRILVPRVAWKGTCEVTADQAVASEGSRAQTAQQVMEQEILPKLQQGPMLANDGWAVLRSFGVKSKDSVVRAQAKLGIHPRKRGFAPAVWWWCLGEQQPPGQEEFEINFDDEGTAE